MLKVLFLIHDLGQGGAEKVLVNLVNNMDRSKFDISVTVLFGGGVNEQFLAPDIHFHSVFPKEVPGNSKLMKLLTPRQLHKLCVKEHYDIEVSYLEGPSARVISGCQNPGTKLVSWIHVEQHTMDKLAGSFRSKKEARACYSKFDQTVCVSQYVHDDFCQLLDFRKPCRVLYNTVESDKILAGANEAAPELADDVSLPPDTEPPPDTGVELPEPPQAVRLSTRTTAIISARSFFISLSPFLFYKCGVTRCNACCLCRF